MHLTVIYCDILVLQLSIRVTFVYLSARDKKGRVHILEVQLDKTYPKCPPSVSAVGIS